MQPSYFRFIPLLLLGVLFIAIFSCTHARGAPLSVVEGPSWYLPRVNTHSGDAPTPLSPRPDDRWDFRGVGDTAWTDGGAPGHRSPLARGLGMDAALRAIDPRGRLFSGHFGFTNWESVVGTRCDAIRQQVDFYFLSRPESILEAFAHGFNLFSSANNHAQDCNLGRVFPTSSPKRGPEMTAEAMAWAARKAESPLLWSGTGSDPYAAQVENFTIDGRTVRVALGAIAVLGWDIPGTATVNFQNPSVARARYERLLESLARSDADLRILSIHTQDGTGSGRLEQAAFRMLKSIAQTFITDYSGDIVFGQGPHTWGGVKVIPRANGRSGVIFTSLGNFVHPGLGSNSDNYVARVLLDRETNRLSEVQVLPYRNLKTTLGFYPSSGVAKAPRANFTWTPMEFSLGHGTYDGFSARF